MRPSPAIRFGAAVTLLCSFAFARIHAAAAAGLQEAAATGSPSPSFVETTLAGLSTLPPFVFFAVMAVVCVLPVPASLFYVVGAAVYGPTTTLLWATGAIAINVGLGQTLASRALRPLATRLLARREMAIPSLRGGRDDALVIALVRITPGVPLFVQNFVLGLANADLALSLAISTPIQLLFATGFVLLGRSAFEGRRGGVIIGLALIVSISLAARLLHRRLASRTSVIPSRD